MRYYSFTEFSSKIDLLAVENYGTRSRCAGAAKSHKGFVTAVLAQIRTKGKGGGRLAVGGRACVRVVTFLLTHARRHVHTTHNILCK